MHMLTTAPCSPHRYAKLLSDVPGVDMKSLTPAEFCEAIAEACGVNKDEYSLGTTRMFFKMGAAAVLEELAEADPEEMKPKLMEMFALFEAKRRSVSFIASDYLCSPSLRRSAGQFRSLPLITSDCLFEAKRR